MVFPLHLLDVREADFGIGRHSEVLDGLLGDDTAAQVVMNRFVLQVTWNCLFIRRVLVVRYDCAATACLGQGFFVNNDAHQWLRWRQLLLDHDDLVGAVEQFARLLLFALLIGRKSRCDGGPI